MKTNFTLLQRRIYCAIALGVRSSFGFAAATVNSADTAPGIDPAFSDANWSSMGGMAGTGGPVVAAVVDGSGNVYIGGEFNLAGGVIANHVAKWDGSRWSALGAGMNGAVTALAVSGSDLYAGGTFSMAGGSAARNIAKWNGSNWSALGSGMNENGPVFALAVTGSDLYAGGWFTTAGGTVSAFIARAYLPPLPTVSVLRSGEQFTISWPTVDTAGFALEQAGPLAGSAAWVTHSATVTDDGANKSVTLPATNSPRFFRLRRP